jgi:hypothetical protein
METYVTIIFFLVLPGIFFIFYSFRLLNGKGNKSFYMVDHIYAGRVYTGIPFGLAFLSLAMAAIPKSVNMSGIFVYMTLGFGVLGLIFAFTQPSFLKPDWLKRLEHEHGDIMSLLRREANEMGLNTWNEQIQTQEDLEEWVAEVRRKHKLK